MRADDVHRVFIGFLNLFAGSRFNIFVDVYGTDAGTYPITRLSQFVQSTSRLVNIQDPAYFVSNDPAHVDAGVLSMVRRRRRRPESDL